MRFLALHGRGTSAKVFEMQAARIVEGLGDDHQFVFVDGSVDTEPGPGADDALSDECFAFFPENISKDKDIGQCRELVERLVEFVTSEGPFDGVMGFSEGGIVAATLLIEDARRPFAGFKCGVFFSAAPPLDPDLSSGVMRCVDPAADGVVVRVPTAHVYGSNEDRTRLRALSPLHPLYTAAGHDRPDENLYECLVQLCDPPTREVYCHDLGHDVPGAKSTRCLALTLRAVERTIERAESQAQLPR